MVKPIKPHKTVKVVTNKNGTTSSYQRTTSSGKLTKWKKVGSSASNNRKKR